MKFQLSILLIFLLTTQNILANNDYVLYVFEREWAGTVCKQKKCSPKYLQNHKGEEFNIHGLWPSGRPGDINYHMMNCDNSFKYNQGLIDSSLLQWMDESYVGLYNPSAPFRQHEYEKHGSCYNYSPEQTTQKQRENTFFSKVKEVNEQYPLISTLADYNIIPSEQKMYQIQDIESALMEGLNTTHRPNIGCVGIKGGKQAIQSIQTCMDLDFNIIDCPRYKNNCKSSKPVYFPVFSPSQKRKGFLQQVEEEIESWLQ